MEQAGDEEEQEDGQEGWEAWGEGGEPHSEGKHRRDNARQRRKPVKPERGQAGNPDEIRERFQSLKSCSSRRQWHGSQKKKCKLIFCLSHRVLSEWGGGVFWTKDIPEQSTKIICGVLMKAQKSRFDKPVKTKRPKHSGKTLSSPVRSFWFLGCLKGEGGLHLWFLGGLHLAVTYLHITKVPPFRPRQRMHVWICQRWRYIIPNMFFGGKNKKWSWNFKRCCCLIASHPKHLHFKKCPQTTSWKKKAAKNWVQMHTKRAILF